MKSKRETNKIVDYFQSSCIYLFYLLLKVLFLSHFSVFHSKTISFFVPFCFSFDRTQIYGCLYIHCIPIHINRSKHSFCFDSFLLTDVYEIQFLLVVICTICTLYKCTFHIGIQNVLKTEETEKVEQRIDIYVYK